MKSILDRIGSRDAINWVNILAVSIAQTFSTLVASETTYIDRVPLFVICDLTAVAGLASCLGIGAMLMHKYATHHSKPLLALLIVCFANFVRSYIFDSLLIRFNFTEASRLAYRFFSSTFALSVIFFLFAYFIASAREIHRQNQELASKTSQLIYTKEASINDLEIQHQALFIEIKNRIDTALSQVMNQKNQRGQTLERVIDEVIRPASYDLYKNSPAIDEILEVSASNKIAWKAVTIQLVTKKPYQTLATAGLIGIALGMFLIPIFSAPSPLQLFLIVAMACCLLWLANFSWRRQFQYSSVSRRLILYCSTTFVVASVLSGATGLLLPESARTPIVYISLWLAAVTVTVLPGYVAASVKLQMNINSDLNAITSALQSELASVNLLRFQFRKNAARLIHGPIQDIVSIAITKLAKSSGDLSSQDIQQLSKQIENVWDAMNKSPNETQSLNNYLQNLVELWDVQAEIILGFDLDEVEIISGNQHTTIAIKELVREACSNSIRHGKATSINVNIHFNQKTMSVWLTVSDNGTGFVQGSGTGLGTQMFDDFTISWERTTFSGKTTVTAEIPFTTSLVN